MRGKVKLQHSEDYYVKVLLTETKAEEIMSTPVISIGEDECFSEVPKKFKEYNIRHLPVVDKEARLMGLISQRDLFRIQPPKKLKDGEWHYEDDMLRRVILQNVMIKKPFCMKRTVPLGDVLVKIVEKKYGCIPIVDEDEVLVGIVTQIDILKIAVQVYQE